MNDVTEVVSHITETDLTLFFYHKVTPLIFWKKHDDSYRPTMLLLLDHFCGV